MEVVSVTVAAIVPTSDMDLLELESRENRVGVVSSTTSGLDTAAELPDSNPSASGNDVRQTTGCGGSGVYGGCNESPASISAPRQGKRGSSRRLPTGVACKVRKSREGPRSKQAAAN